MKALAVDSASQTLTVAVQNENAFFQTTLEMGLSQSEKLLPVIDNALKEIRLTPDQLDFTAVTLGPGSFTGLRLGLATLKALTLSNGTPLYGINSLEAYAFPYRNFKGAVLSLVESKDREFFYTVYKNAKSCNEIQASTAEEVLEAVKDKASVIAVGPGAKKLKALTQAESLATENILFVEPAFTDGRALLYLAEEMIEQKKPALQDYDGPVYYKRSEAEIVLEAKSAKST